MWQGHIKPSTDPTDIFTRRSEQNNTSAHQEPPRGEHVARDKELERHARTADVPEAGAELNGQLARCKISVSIARICEKYQTILEKHLPNKNSHDIYQLIDKTRLLEKELSIVHTQIHRGRSYESHSHPRWLTSNLTQHLEHHQSRMTKNFA